eukprot:CAMPEP_0181469976 /NCGR_PEP_ID=MMETSP1110-20121109/38306_1 /TAXON_ID=174948 /ORGANISM="Symbiodinium sp., Strain CCMP421" /LENGTH=85 /DNA_ID=CAMNT_0023594919 /DNA_START=88 /DNA_END=345 /DNA_ORIENTATION=+
MILIPACQPGLMGSVTGFFSWYGMKPGPSRVRSTTTHLVLPSLSSLRVHSISISIVDSFGIEGNTGRSSNSGSYATLKGSAEEKN